MKKILLLIALVLAPFLQAKVVLSENFEKFTEGSETSFVDIIDINELTTTPGWIASVVQQAGGCAYIGVSGTLISPMMDLSANNGNYSVTFRAKTTATTGGYVIVSDATMTTFGMPEISAQWETYTVPLMYGTASTQVAFSAMYNDVLIDDIVIDDGGVAIPEPLPATEFTRESFKANWKEALNAQSYILNVFTYDYNLQTTLFTPRYIVENKEVTGTSYTVTEGEFDEPYYYTVSAKSGDVISEPSTRITVKPESVQRPEASAATNVTATDFTANWSASDIATLYYVHVLKQHTAPEAETFTVIDTDFSDIKSEGTVDAPQKEIEWLFDGDWNSNMPVFADGIIGINNQDFDLFGQAFLQSPPLDLTKCGGKITISFDAFSRQGLSKAMVNLANTTNTGIAFADTHEFNVTEQSNHIEYTLTGGSNVSQVVITSEEKGMLFIDNLKVTVELPADAAFVLPVRTIPATECQVHVDRLGATDKDVIAYYVVASWAVRHEEGVVRQIPEVLSEPSAIITVDRSSASVTTMANDANKPNVTALTGSINISNPLREAIAIYTPDGRCVYTVANPAESASFDIEAGIYIVSVGETQFKIFVKR